MLKLSAGRKKVLAVAVAAAFACTSAFAQESVMSEASIGVFTGDTDNFMSLTNWNLVDFEKCFIEARLNQKNLNAGLGLNIGGIYIGADYTGNFINGSSDKNTGVATTIGEKGNNKFETWTNVVTNENNYNKNNPNNNVNVLVGIGNMGISLGYSGINGSSEKGNFDESFNKASSTSTTNSVGQDTATYTNTEVKKGRKNQNVTNTPVVGFGINLDAIRPYVFVGVPIYANSQKGGKTTKTIENGNTKSAVDIDAEQKYDYIGLMPLVGVEIDLGPGCLSASYQADVDFTKEGVNKYISTTTQTDYSAKGSKVTKTEIILDNPYSTKFNNTINIGYTLSSEVADRLTLGANIGLGLDINSKASYASDNGVLSIMSKTTTKYDATYDANTYGREYYGREYTETIETTVKNPQEIKKNFDVNAYPTLAGAVKFEAVPEKVSLVLGAGVTFNIENTNTTVNYDGAVTTTTTRTTNSLTGQDVTTKTAKFNNTLNESGATNTTYSTSYEANIAAVFTPTENFGISAGIKVGGVASPDSIAGWAFSIGTEIKF